MYKNIINIYGTKTYIFTENNNKYIKINDVLKSYNKNYKVWHADIKTKKLYKQIAKNNNISVVDIEINISTADNTKGLYIHTDIISALVYWCNKPKNNLIELKYKNMLYNSLLIQKLNPIKEYRLYTGHRIDILIPNYIIEIKNIKNWTSAIGQILHYSLLLPDRKLILLLFGESKDIIYINKICNIYNINVAYNIMQVINIIKKIN